MTIEPLGPYGRPRRVPATSREINQAIELLKEVKADPAAIRLLDIWNAHRLVDASLKVETNEELRNLFAGLKALSERTGPALPSSAKMDEGAWS